MSFYCQKATYDGLHSKYYEQRRKNDKQISHRNHSTKKRHADYHLHTFNEPLINKLL